MGHSNGVYGAAIEWCIDLPYDGMGQLHGGLRGNEFM